MFSSLKERFFFLFCVTLFVCQVKRQNKQNDVSHVIKACRHKISDNPETLHIVLTPHYHPLQPNLENGTEKNDLKFSKIAFFVGARTKKFSAHFCGDHQHAAGGIEWNGNENFPRFIN